jgi:hypothetical protein
MLADGDHVVIITDLPSHAVLAGDVGVVVHAYRDCQAYEVEFVRLDGSSSGTATLASDQLRAVSPRDMPHVRERPA